MQREREAPPAPSSLLGIRPWVFVLIFSVLVLLFLPPVLSYSLRGFRPIAVRSGWDTLNLLLVLFAILCGVLSRRSGGDDAERLARPAAHEEWLGFANHRAQGSYSHRAGTSTAEGVVRSRSSGYYSGEAALDSGGDAAARFPRSAPPEEWLGFDNHRAQGSHSHSAEDPPAAGVLRSRSSGYYPSTSTGSSTLDSRGDDSARLSRPAPHEEWLGFSNHQAHGSYSHPAEASPAAGVLRSRSSGYYPIESSDGVTLRSGSGGGTEEWRCYDDSQINRRRSEFGGWEGEGFRRGLEAKTIAVDTYVLQRSHSPRSGSRSSSPSPATQGLLGTSEMEEIPGMEVVEDEIYEPEKPHLPSPLAPEQRQPRGRRRVEKFAEEMEVDKDEISNSEKPHPRSPFPPPLRQRQARRKSMEKLPEVEVGQNEAMLETRKAHLSPPPAAALRHQRRGSVGDTPNWEMEQDPNRGIEKPYSPVPAAHHPPAVPPPQQQEEAEEKRSRRKRSGGGADISAAWGLFFPKKKWTKTNKSSNNTPLNCEEPASSVPPPPRPPPPLSVFHQLLSHKKGVSTNRRIHSESAATSPPPPPPPPPALRSLNWHDKGKEKMLFEPPLPPSASLPSQQEKPNLSKYSPRPSSPLLLPPPPPPPPRRPSHTHQPAYGGEMVVNRLLNKRGPEGELRKIKERETATVSCPSPDVDNKADLFIARCHANWKLEKQNSMREKERRKHRKLQEAELKRA